MEDVKKIWFSREQYEYLNKVFGEVIGTSKTTLEEHNIQAGKRTVVEYIKARTR